SNPATVVVALLSHSFYESSFCANEIGAAWINQRKIFLYTIPPFTFKSLKGVMADRQAPSLGSRASLDEIKDTFDGLLSPKLPNDAQWDNAARRFLEHLGPAAYDIERRRAGIARDLFVSTPMSGLSEEEYQVTRQTAIKLIEVLRPRPAALDLKY